MPEQTGEIVSNIALFPEENPCPVLRVDLDGVLLYANRASTDLLKQWQCVVGGTVPDSIREKISLFLEDEQDQELEVRCGRQELSFAMVAIVDRGYVNFYGRDVTKDKLIEDRLARSSERLKRAQEIANLGSWELNIADNSLIWSDEAYRIFGYQPNEIVPSYEVFLEAVHPEDRDAVNEAYLSSIDEGRNRYEIEHRVLQKKSGKTIYVQEKCEHVRDSTGKIIRSVGMTHDITARKQKQMEIERLNAELEARTRKLESLNKESEAFNYMLAHDLRKPLTVISGYSEILENLLSDKLDQQTLGYFRQITNSTLNMSQLINALLEFSRLNHAEPKRERINLADMANMIMGSFKFSEPHRNIRFLVPEKITANVDKDLFNVVMENLLGNAWKFTAERKETVIEFGITEGNGKSVYFIRDNGIGFSEEDVENLFAPFQRLGGAEATSGFGIGLATVERIIQRHEGQIWAEGTPGKGATFYFIC